MGRREDLIPQMNCRVRATLLVFMNSLSYPVIRTPAKIRGWMGRARLGGLV